MMRVPLTVLLSLALCQLGPAVEPSDPIKDRLDHAHTAYDAELNRASEALKERLAQQQAAAKRAGDLDQLKRILAQLERFTVGGEVPKTSGGNEYRSAVGKARDRLAAALTLARKEYTQAGDVDKAEVVDAELKKNQQAATDLPAVRDAPGTPGRAAQPPADARVLWIYPDKTGYVIRTINSEWIERNNDGDAFAMKEVARNAEYIEVTCLRRNWTLRIYNTKLVIGFRTADPSLWGEARTGGKWVNPASPE